MRNQIVTRGIVLARTDFQEADRILTILTPDHGKLRVIAKGVRRPRSKLAGGIELLSVNDITVLPGRGELATLISSRLITHYGHIVGDIDRTMLAYELLKKINRVTEDNAEPEYFSLLKNSLAGLNNTQLPVELAEVWFAMQLLKITGHAPNLATDIHGKKLELGQSYHFAPDHMAFYRQEDAPFRASHIKLMRLANTSETPQVFLRVGGVRTFAPEILRLARGLISTALY